MAAEHVVVDGSNIATEGRSTPSLAQLEDAVAELRKELPDAVVTVVVDATFAHRVDPSELERFEQAALRGEYVYPPAGAIGRGDAFLLRIAERVDGIVLSNDSFQEFHGEHEWLFERGRLLGATPVPGVGWIFVPRTPVRGPRSRVAVRDASRAKVRVVKAIAQATKEAVRDPATERPLVSAESRRDHRVRGGSNGPSPQAVNDPMTFISFIAEHPLGDEIEGLVESFTSHGAVVRYGAVRCYVPLSGLGDPAPRAAREALRRGEERTFVVTALDPFRRGVELALPGVAVVSGRPSEETVAAEVRMARRSGSGRGADHVEPQQPPRTRRAPTGTRASESPMSQATPVAPARTEPASSTSGATKSPATKSTSARAGATKSPATKSPATKSPPTKSPATKTTSARAAATKTTSARAAATKTTSARAAATKTTSAKSPASKSPATKTTSARAAATKSTSARAGAAKSPAAKSPASKAVAAAPAKSAATESIATSTPSRRAPAKKSPASEASAAKPAPTKSAPARSAAATAGSKGSASKGPGSNVAGSNGAGSNGAPTRTARASAASSTAPAQALTSTPARVPGPRRSGR